jgi:hypothetical protein
MEPTRLARKSSIVVILWTWTTKCRTNTRERKERQLSSTGPGRLALPQLTGSSFDLPPTLRAKPLPVGRQSKDVTAKKQKSKSKSSHAHSDNYKGDDTPRAFTRLLAFGKNGHGHGNGLDDGRPKASSSKKRKRGKADPTEQQGLEGTASAEQPLPSIEPTAEPKSAVPLKIKPGERLADFAARVDQALPIAGLTNKTKKIEGVRERVTKHEKRLRRLQDGWRKDDARIKEQEEEEREEAEEEWDEKIAGLDRETRELMTTMAQHGATGGKKKKKQRLIGEVRDDDDPWAVLHKTRDAPKGLHDVVEAPPVFSKLPREVFKGAKVGDVPKNAGSLRRREELLQTRKEIISSYRSLMARNRHSA